MEIKQVINKSLTLYKEKFLILTEISILGNLLLLINYIGGDFFGNAIAPWSGILFFIGLTLAYCSQIILIEIISNKYLNRKFTLKESFLTAKHKYLKYLSAQIFFVIIAGFGLLLFILPGIYWITVFCLAPTIVAIEDNSHPFRESKRLIKGFFWKALLLNTITTTIAAIVLFINYKLVISNKIISALLCQLCLSIVFIPILIAISVIFYHTLKNIKGADTFTVPIVPLKKSRGIMGCLAAFVLFIGFIFTVIAIIFGLLWISKTRTGKVIVNRYYEIRSLKSIEFPDISIDRPIEWRLTADQQRYKLSRIIGHRIINIALWLRSVENIGIKEKDLNLNNSDIGLAILTKELLQPDIAVLFKEYEVQPMKIVKIDNHLWMEHKIITIHEKSSLISVLKNVYTIVDNNILGCTYMYSERFGEKNWNVIDEEEEIHEILGSLIISKKKINPHA